MNAKVSMMAGVCGFKTEVKASSEDSQNVSFDIKTDCEKVAKLAQALQKAGPVDAFQEMHKGSEGVIMSAARITHKGCCAACVVPCGIFKAAQVAAELNLPRDVEIRIAKEEA